MRRFLPDSLAAWSLLILIAGLAIAEAATLTAIVENRAVSSRMTGFFHLSERVSSMSRAIAAEPKDARAALVGALSSDTLSVGIGRTPVARDSAGGNEELAELEDLMQEHLADSGVTDVRVERNLPDVGDDSASPQIDDTAGPVERVLTQIGEDYTLDDSYIVSVQLADGTWVNFGVPVAPTPNWWSLNTAILTAFIIALVLAASIWALRGLTAPYAVLAAASERLGRDLNASALPEQGPREVRAAAHAFNVMQERLQRSFSDREQLVAAISHDLRTPTTRLRLRADFIDDPDQRARMLADLDEIETMTRAVLAFASNSAQPEPRAVVDLVSMLRSLCDDMPGATLTLADDTPARVAYRAEPVALRRAVINIIENAVKYGRCARVSLAVAKNAIHIVVDDDGPGIPVTETETVFRPFRRLEDSRNRETGGTGLGLTIARTVARAHGGEVTLTNRPEGGLRAEIVLPLAAAETSAVVPAKAGTQYTPPEQRVLDARPRGHDKARAKAASPASADT
jgi:signal transduction histidine kinase